MSQPACARVCPVSAHLHAQTRWQTRLPHRRHQSAGLQLLAYGTAGQKRNAVAFHGHCLEAFGHVTVAWLWLDLALTAHEGLPKVDGADHAHRQGLVQAMRYFYDYELPRLPSWLAPVSARTATCREMQEDWF